MTRNAAAFKFPVWLRRVCCSLAGGALLASAVPARAVILWSDLGATLVHESGPGSDILGGAVKRDDTAADTLYFKFHVDPLSDVNTEKYFAGFQLFEGDGERLGVGNSLEAWAYSAFNTAGTGESNKVFGDYDLHTSRPESSGVLGNFLPYEMPRRGIENTIVFKVEYVPGGDDRVTVWLNPDLSPGATEGSQLESSTTRFRANCSFDQIRIRHGGGGGGWTFSDMAIATSFTDFVGPGEAASDEIAIGEGQGVSAFAFRSWPTSVHALAQTRDGYLWVGNDDGVARFDGVRFVSFGLSPSGEGYRSGPVHALLGDDQGALWIGSIGGLTRWSGGRNGQFVSYATRDGLPADSVTALAEDGERQIWVGTEAGLTAWKSGHPVRLGGVEQFRGKTITALFKERNGAMWVGVAGTGVFCYSGGKFAELTEPSVEGLLRDAHCLLVDRSGALWIGAGDDVVLCRQGEQWRRYRIPRHLTRPFVSALAEEPDGTIWAGSVSEGLFQFKGGKLSAINAANGLSDNLVQSLLIDRDGSLWVGTDAALNRRGRKSLAAFGQNEGLGYGAVQGLAEMAAGELWAGKPSEGVYRWEGGKFMLSRHEPVNVLLTARDGTCWAGGPRTVLHFNDPKGSPDQAEVFELAGLNVSALEEDSRGVMWAGTREGQLWKLVDGQWRGATNLWLTHPITAIVHGSDASLWIGTEGAGLYRFLGEQRVHYDKSRGLLSDLVRTLRLDADGTLWIGTAGGGLARWRGGRVTTFTTREGLPDNTISEVLDDGLDRLWLGCNRGIACVGKSDLEAVAAGRATAVYPQVYGAADGMVSEECAGGFSPAGLRAKSGLLWFPTLKGVVVADPRSHGLNGQPTTVALEEVLVDGAQAGRSQTDAGADDTLRIPPGRHGLEVHYTGLNFDAPERVRFRYQLEGWDSDWVEAGRRRIALYSYVPPGNYRFRVKACNSDGIWNESAAVLALDVAPYFWQTRVFIGLVALGVLGGVGGTVRFVEKRKLQRRLKQLEQERSVERERARIAQDLHDDLGSSLTRISLLSDLTKTDRENPALVEAHANRISQSAAQTVRALEEIVWAVRPGSDSLQSLVEYIAHFANELFENDRTRCRLDLPPNLPSQPLPPEIRHNIFLVVKEALTNALKHAGAKEVRVQAKVAGNSLEIIVQDDGRGFNPGTRTGESLRNGMGNMRRRADAMGATLSLQSAPGKGTAVRLKVDLTVRRRNGKT